MKPNRRRRIARRRTRVPYFPEPTSTWTEGKVRQWYSARDIEDDIDGYDFEAISIAADIFGGTPLAMKLPEGQVQFCVYPDVEAYQSGAHWARPGPSSKPCWRTH